MQRPESAPDGNTPEIPPMYTPSQLRMLRMAVVAMGVILLVGFATVIGRIVYLLNVAPATEQTAGERSPAAIAPLARSGAAVELPKGAIVKHLAISGNRLAIHFEGPGGAGIHIIDLATPGHNVTLPIVNPPAP